MKRTFCLSLLLALTTACGSAKGDRAGSVLLTLGCVALLISLLVWAYLDERDDSKKPGFRVIRAGTDYRFVIVVTPADADPDSSDAKFYRRADWAVRDVPAGTFSEISREAAIGSFGGVADGVGFAEKPDIVFESLEEITAWILLHQLPEEETDESAE